jgi:hypothetical protein
MDAPLCYRCLGPGRHRIDLAFFQPVICGPCLSTEDPVLVGPLPETEEEQQARLFSRWDGLLSRLAQGPQLPVIDAVIVKDCR